MDPLRIVIRVVFAYVILLVLIRLGGKRLIKHATPFDFTVALILGDLVDDVVWAEVNTSVFVVASGVLLLVHTAFDLLRFRAATIR